MRVVPYDLETIAVSNAFVGATWVHLNRWRSFAPHVVQTLRAALLSLWLDPDDVRWCCARGCDPAYYNRAIWMRLVQARSMASAAVKIVVEVFNQLRFIEQGIYHFF